jgi:hypothetical protein
MEEAVTSTRTSLDAAEDLVLAGWTRQETVPTFTLVMETEGVNGEALGAAVDVVRPLLTAAKLVANWGSDFLTLEQAESGMRPLVLTDHAHGTLQATFDTDDLPDAEAAFNGDAAAALRLNATWHAELNIDPGRCLSAADPRSHWLAVSSTISADELLRSRPWWELKPLVQPDKPLVVAIHDVNSDIDVRTTALRICALSLLAPGVNVDSGTAPGPGPQAEWVTRTAPPGMPTPEALHPSSVAGQDDAVEGVVRTLQQQTTACCWALLATNVVIQGRVARAEFFGLQRQEWPLDALGPELTSDQHEAAFRLWRTCVEGGTPDRLLATRQVVSLYRHAPWAYAEDVIDASEPLFLALRSTATAEALRAQRDARALALSVARQTADATTGLAKNAVERALAVFAAVGGIIVARTSNTLTVAQADGLRHLLAIYLLILVVWSFLLEGRPVTSAIDALTSDLADFSDLLTEREQRSILASKTVTQAKSQAWAARIVVPLAYLGAAIVALTLRG